MSKEIGYWKWLYKRYRKDLIFIAHMLICIGTIILALLVCYGCFLLGMFITNFPFDSVELHIQILAVFISNLFLSLLVAYIFIKSYKKYEKENLGVIV